MTMHITQIALRTLLGTTLLATTVQAQFPDFTPPTPFLGAALRGDTQGVTAHLRQGIDPNAERFFGWPALTLAIMQANPEMTLALLAHGADINAADANGNTPLMWAVGQETPQPALTEELLRRGANPLAQNKFGESALTWALRRADHATVARLRQAGASMRETVRQAVERAIVPLQKSGPQFVKVSGCISCHHQSLPQMVYGAARERGFGMDQAAAEQQVKAVMAMFRPAREKLADGSVTPPNPPISVGYSLLGLHAEGYAPDETTAAMAASIARTQLPDGRFGILGVRPPMESSVFSATALGLRSLQLYGGKADDRVVKACNWLAEGKPVTNEDHTMRLMGLSWCASPESAVAAVELLATQRGDGGWGQLAGLESDAYATGQALTALALAGRTSTPGYERGLAYLLRTQLADGTWHVRTRANAVQPLKDSGFPHGRDQWISAAGTSWAALALTISQPAAASGSTE